MEVRARVEVRVRVEVGARVEVRVGSPSESESSRVSFESRKGTW